MKKSCHRLAALSGTNLLLIVGISDHWGGILIF